MEATEAAEQIRELEEEKHERDVEDRFRNRVAVYVAFLAMLLTLATVGGENASKEMMAANIRASDTWAFYQARTIRQTMYELSAAELEAVTPGLSEADRKPILDKAAAYRIKAARYESEPVVEGSGGGKKELAEAARKWEEIREHAERQDPNFDFAAAFIQIAIVLGSVAILSRNRFVLMVSMTLGALGSFFLANGFFLFANLLH